MNNENSSVEIFLSMDETIYLEKLSKKLELPLDQVIEKIIEEHCEKNDLFEI
tara:strand:+ start:46 stop:201 length:156 start_codon:yes stop_codon:yes gene_type:complete